MNENIDLTKILKDCPDGWKLYSSLFGEVKFVKCIGLHSILVRNGGKYYYFTQDGMFIFEGTVCKECALFPSKEQRDWSKFTAPWYKKSKFDPKTLKPFDKVLVRDSNISTWRCTFYSHTREDGSKWKYITGNSAYEWCIPYNDDTKHLVGTTDEAPEYYKYWEE